MVSSVASTAREVGKTPTRVGEQHAHARANPVHGYGAGVAVHEIVIWSDYI